MGAGDKAEETLRRMIEMNPDHSTAIQKLLKLKGIDLRECSDSLLAPQRSVHSRSDSRCGAGLSIDTDEQLPEEKVDKAVVILEGFAESYPRASAPRRMLLDITSGMHLNTKIISVKTTSDSIDI